MDSEKVIKGFEFLEMGINIPEDTSSQIMCMEAMAKEYVKQEEQFDEISRREFADIADFIRLKKAKLEAIASMKKDVVRHRIEIEETMAELKGKTL